MVSIQGQVRAHEAVMLLQHLLQRKERAMINGVIKSELDITETPNFDFRVSGLNLK